MSMRLIPLLSVLSIGLLLPASAHAYLDPGSGSFVIQMILASLLGVLFYVKTAWHQIKAFFASLFGKERDKKDVQP